MRRSVSTRAADDTAPAGTSRSYLAIVDVDRFDVLDELVGYTAARRMLAGLAEEIARTLPQCGRTRLGRGAVVVDWETTPDTAEAAAEALARALARPVEVADYRFDLAVTIGVVEAGVGNRAEQLSAADRAVTTARRRHARVQIGAGDGVMPATDRLSLMRDLQKAIRDDTLELHYQPKVRARSGETVAAEALLRWNHPHRGYVPPAMFVPIAERTGDIGALTEWVVGRAIADQAQLLRMGHTLTFDLNISGGLLADPGYGWRLLHQFTALQGLIGFEITETAMIGDPERALSNLQIFAEAGIRLAIDDYGSGFSSLAYLRQLPITELKIDRMFVSNLTTSQRDPLLIRSTIDLAHALGMEVTAEGVDSPTTLALLQVMGCDQVQGYLLSRPLPLDRLATYLTAQRTPEAIAQRRRISG